MSSWLRVCGLVSVCLLVSLTLAGEKDGYGDDGRIGAVVDSQGTVSIQGVADARWAPAGMDTPILPGDLIRTDARGANAAQLRLASGVHLILGPNTLVRVSGDAAASLLRGEAELSIPDKVEFRIELEQGKTLRAKGTQIWRVSDGKARLLKEEPNWLQGFKGSITSESLGSLVANVDGRDVELSIGYHSGTVDIRDQIARTVVEETFVNHSDSTLEGVFFFPLPHDASISGFGMWIGGELVEADVVEKQRAREIYETILREKRDPGLLEWSGGNLFKARVYPIFPHSEKRVKVTYTQVLPLEGNDFTYDYALRSELLRRNPLRELNIEVKIHSEVPLGEVTCPTHQAAVTQSKNSSVVKFSAQEYVPDRDFQVKVGLKTDDSQVVVIPHRRGEDGYFMLMITPPRSQELGIRPVLPDKGGQDWVILADTSASMSDAQREARDAFIAGLLSLLGEKDRFTIAAYDVSTRYYSAAPVPVSEHHKQAALDWLAQITPLGWTDLDQLFQDVLKQSGERTRVIFVGDGAHTAHDGDSQALARRLAALKVPAGASFHAVAPGTTFEMVVLETISSMGDGSLHMLKSTAEAQKVAWELLEQVLKPTLKDVSIRFSGFQVARAYPEKVHNIPDGGQQIVLGRYLPTGKRQSGSVVVEGMLSGKKVSWKSRVTFADDQKGNSFIPRLWARRHLDVLLSQGRTPTVKDDIIDLSERFNIMTPYTSFLVLESDADRLRFGVKKRFRMRDGEKFFAKGRDKATNELLAQHMKKAGTWRLGLRRSAMSALRTLGRYGHSQNTSAVSHGGREAGGRWKSRKSAALKSGVSYHSSPVLLPPASAPMGGGNYRMSLNGGGGKDKMDYLDEATVSEEEWSGQDEDNDGLLAPTDVADSEVYDMPAEEAMPDVPLREMQKKEAKQLDRSFAANLPIQVQGAASVSQSLSGKRGRMSGEIGFGGSDGFFGWGGEGEGYAQDEMSALTRNPSLALDGRFSYHLSWFSGLFPYLPPRPVKAAPVEESDRVWPAEVKALSDSLQRWKDLSDLPFVMRVTSKSESTQAPRKRISSSSSTETTMDSSGWVSRFISPWNPTQTTWCDGKERGVLKPAFGLARTREATPEECRTAPTYPQPFAFQSLHDSYEGYNASMKTVENGLIVVRFASVGEPAYITEMTIDPSRKVTLESRTWYDGALTGITYFSNFHKAGGFWWAGLTEFKDKDGHNTSVTFTKVEKLPAGQMQAQFKEINKRLKDSIVVRDPLPDLAAARRVLEGKRPTAVAHLVMMMHYTLSQRWELVDEHMVQLSKLLGRKQGFAWLKQAVLQQRRDNQKLAGMLLKKARELSRKPSEDELAKAALLVGQASGIFQNNEMLVFQDAIRPVYQRHDKALGAMKTWMEARVYPLEAAGRSEEALALRKETARKYTWDYNAQYQFAWQLSSRGRHQDALMWLDKAITQMGPWGTWEVEYLHTQAIQILRQQGKMEQLLAYIEPLLASDPTTVSIYQQYLSVLVFMGRTEQFDKTMTRWFAEGKKDGKLTQAAAGRLQAAILHAMGQGYDMYTNVVLVQWADELVDAGRRLVLDSRYSYLVGTIMNNWTFSRLDSAKAMREELRKLVIEKADSVKGHQLSQVVGWIWPRQGSKEEIAQFQPVLEAIKTRWVNEKNSAERYVLGGLVVQALAILQSTEQRLAFSRRRVKEAGKQYRDMLRQELLSALLSVDWTQAHEDEAFDLVEKMGETGKEEDRFFVRVEALMRITAWMGQARFAVQWKMVEDKAQLSRSELAKKQKEIVGRANEAVISRLAEMKKRLSPSFGIWLDLERWAYQVKAGKDLKEVQKECQARLDDWNWETSKQWPRNHLGQRVVGVLLYLAVRPGNDGKLGERMLTFLEQRSKADPDAAVWRDHMYRLLVALDRPELLLKRLKTWTSQKDADPYLRVTLGYVLAEQGKLEDAVAIFGALHKDGMLAASEYRTLADWQLVLGREDARRESLMAQYGAMDEYRLSQWINGLLSKRRQAAASQGAGPLDPEVVGLFTALFRKSTYPQSYVWQLSDWYRDSKDFRLVGALADGLIGHTPQQIYPVMQSVNYLMEAIGDEAAVDSVNEELDRVGRTAKTNVDKRALWMLRLAVERRAAAIADQAGPHVKAALQAMKASYKGKWGPGEPRLMCEFLAALGAIPQKQLQREQLRQLKELLRKESDDSPDRAYMTVSLANTLWSYGKMDRAIDVLEAEYRRVRGKSKISLPDAHRSLLSTLISYLQSRSRYGRAETMLLEEMSLERLPARIQGWKQQLYNLYVGAVSIKATTSLGSGAGQFERAYGLMVKALTETSDPNFRYTIITTVTSLLRTGHYHYRLKAAALVHLFAWKTVPPLLMAQTSNYQGIVSNVASVLKELLGAKAGLMYLVERIEKEPKWLRFSNQDGWGYHAYSLGQWRTEASGLGKVEERLLKIVLRELRRDLERQTARQRQMYHAQHSDFWVEQKEAFAAVAEEMFEKHKGSSHTLLYVADYVFNGLAEKERGTEMLSQGYEAGVLDDTGRVRLVQYLFALNRQAKAVKPLTELVNSFPNHPSYVAQLMEAHCAAGAKDKAVAAMEVATKHFKENHLWSESTAALLAHGCLKCELLQRAVPLFDEAITLHQRSMPNRGIGMGTLSNYYNELAQVHTKLGDTVSAVEAACGAVVSWGSNLDSRRMAMEGLRQVLRESGDLDDFSRKLDAQVEKTGLENPIVRKALGMIYSEKKRYQAAIAQLTKSLEIAPMDEETHRALIYATDQLGDVTGGIRQTLALLTVAPRQIELYNDLAKRYAKSERKGEAERAITAMVEVLPEESESHAALATYRQEQKRWKDAVEQWHHVIRVRTLEPAGWLGLAGAQYGAGDRKEARKTIRHLIKSDWPEHFGDVHQQARGIKEAHEE